jgi:hypothetical protein
MLRCRSIASFSFRLDWFKPFKTFKPFKSWEANSRICPFEQPAKGFFQHPARLAHGCARH